MVQILFFVLKIIGIILLVLLGILLFVLLSLLFVPLRYRVSGKWQGSPCFEAQVSWFLHALSFKGGYDSGEKGLKLRVKLFGFTVWKNEETGEKVGEVAEAAAARESGADVGDRAQTEDSAKSEADSCLSGSENGLSAELPPSAAVPPTDTAELASLDEDELYQELLEDEARFRRQSEERALKNGVRRMWKFAGNGNGGLLRTFGRV